MARENVKSVNLLNIPYEITVLNLSDCCDLFSDNQIANIFLAFIKTSTITSLDFSFNHLKKLSDETTDKLADELAKTKIINLNLSHCFDLLPNNQKIKLFLGLLKNPTIISLDFSFNNLRQISDEETDEIYEGLTETKITNLNLYHCLASLLDQQKIKLLLALLKNVTITNLDFCQNGPLEISEKSIRETIEELAKTKIANLNLSNWFIRSIDTQKVNLFLTLLKHPTIISLDFSFNNLRQISDEETNKIADELTKTKIINLNLSNCFARLPDNQKIKLLLAVLKNITINSLNFNDNGPWKISEESISIISIELTKTKIANLNLSGCFADLPNNQKIKLFIALLKNPTITSLDFNDNKSYNNNGPRQVSAEEISEIVEELAKTKIVSLNLSNCFDYLPTKQKIRLFITLLRNPAIVRLNFNDNNLFSDSLFYNILSLEISDKEITEVVEELAKTKIANLFLSRCFEALPINHRIKLFSGLLKNPAINKLEFSCLWKITNKTSNEIAEELAKTKIANLNLSDFLVRLPNEQKIKLFIALLKNQTINKLELYDNDSKAILAIKKILVEENLLDASCLLLEKQVARNIIIRNLGNFRSVLVKAHTSVNILLFSNLGKKLCNDVWKNTFDFFNDSDFYLVKKCYHNALQYLNDNRVKNVRKEIPRITWI